MYKFINPKSITMKRLFILTFILPLLISAGKKDNFKIPKDFTFIPMGSMQYKGKTVSVDAFIMQKTEVSNKQYREFLNGLKKNHEIEKLKIAQIDSIKWRQAGEYMEPYVEFYHKHPAYDNYPVVNVSREAVQLYCEWLSEKWKKEYNQKVKFRLPTEYEWIYAAKGGTKNRFPWNVNALLDKKGNPKCNFKYVRQQDIRANSKSKSNTIELINNMGKNKIMTPVDSYQPNNYGLYNMSGNAAEMTSEKGVIKGGSWNSTGYYMQIESESEYTEKDAPSPFVGFRVVYDYLPERDK